MPKKKISKKTKALKQIKNLETKVTRLLDQAKVKYKVIEHKVVYTAHDTAQTTKKKLSEIAKVVLVKATGPQPVILSERSESKDLLKSKDYLVLIVLPAGKYVDFSGIKKALKAKKISMATEKDITKYLKTKVGLLHPFGIQYNLQTLLDKGLAKTKKIIASAGTYTDSVELTVKDFEKLIKPIKGAFAKAKR